MRSSKRPDPPTVDVSEQGLFAKAGRQTGVPLPEALVHFRELVSADMDWVDSRKTRNRRMASRVKGASLALTAASTVVLGIPAIPGRATVALPLVAVVSLLGGLEAFHNWRSRWVLMEESKYRLNRLRDEMDLYLVATPPAEMSDAQLKEFFAEHQAIWADVSRQWIEFRRHDPLPQADQSGRL